MRETPGAARQYFARTLACVFVGVLAGVISLWLRFALLPELGVNEPFLPLFPLILFSAVIAGFWAGATCLAIGVIGGWYLFLGPPHSFVLAPYELGGLVGTSVAGLIILLMCGALIRLVAQANAAAAHERTISREFEHRIRNTLTLVLAIGRRTFTEGRPLEDARGEFEARLQALSEAHAALLDASGDNAELREIVVRILTPFGYAPGDGRFVIEGPAVMLGPDAATAVALALHELSTNAVKYGALSAPTGKVAVRWRLDGAPGQDLRLSWQESGGPEVVAPSRRGFGSQLIERNLSQALDGTAELEFAPEGLRAEIAARLR
jgi:two-component sensor histidine kinase